MKQVHSMSQVIVALISTTIILQALLLNGPQANASGNQGCWSTPTVPGRQQSCSCTVGSIGPLANYHCGSQGMNKRAYKTCRPSDAGYKNCGREFEKVGSSWDCGISVNWTVWTACIGAALVCEAQCAGTSPTTWKKCYACWSAYIAACTGCSIRTCTKENSIALWGLEMIYATDSCPDGSTGA